MHKPIYYINPENRTIESIRKTLLEHPEIKFISLVGVDLGNNTTDEKIPVDLIIDDLENFFNEGVQTDGSSVYLPKIAELNNAKVDIIPDLDVKWLVDYNYGHIDEATNLPVGTVLIPSFLKHDDQLVGSRAILKKAVVNIKSELIKLFKSDDKILNYYGLTSVDEISDIVLTTATELEFWVQTPGDRADFKHLSTSQSLKEQYWKRTVGQVRTALEQSLIELNRFGYDAEMGHKEVGGVSSSIDKKGRFNHIMEQLEIDWKYSTTMQSADHELFSKDIVKEIFVRNGLDVTFLAKPIEGVAGSGEHTHIGMAIKKTDGKLINLFNPNPNEDTYLSPIGWGSLMGLLKNYEVVSPFVTSSNDALNRLKPGYEAPVCIVSSLGSAVDTPSRNRTVLAGLIRDFNNPLATRFEIRVPNPTTNTYLSIATFYQTMLDGIKAVHKANLSAKELEKEFDKTAGDEGFYLEKNRQYRSEEDVFEYYTEEERNQLFGLPPVTVWDNVKSLDLYEEKLSTLTQNNVFTDKIIESYRETVIMQWTKELRNRIIPQNSNVVRECVPLHSTDFITDIDVVNWEKVNMLRYELMKDSLNKKSLFTKLRGAIDAKDYDTVSKLQIEMNEKITLLNKLYYNYKRNLF